MLQFRAGYPGLGDDKRLDENLRFYQGRLPSRPRGAFIDDILATWRGDYRLLEAHHGYIQWLFPIRDPQSMNVDAQPLQPHEAAAIREDPTCLRRYLGAADMMFDFLGFTLMGVAQAGAWLQRVAADERAKKGSQRSKGALVRGVAPFLRVQPSGDERHRRDRFGNWKAHGHNDLRVTRMLKSLAEMGLEALQYQWLHCIAYEVCATGALAEKRRPFVTFYTECVRGDTARALLKAHAAALEQSAGRRRGAYAADVGFDAAVSAGLVDVAHSATRRETGGRTGTAEGQPAPAGEPADRATTASCDLAAGDSGEAAAKRHRAAAAPGCASLQRATLFMSGQLTLRNAGEIAKHVAAATGATLSPAERGLEAIQEAVARVCPTATGIPPAKTPALVVPPQPAADSGLQPPHALILVVAAEQRPATADKQAARLAKLCAESGVDPTTLHVYVVQEAWLPVALGSPSTAAATLRDYLSVRYPAYHPTWLR